MRYAMVVTFAVLGLVEARSSQTEDKFLKTYAQGPLHRKAVGIQMVVRSTAELVKAIPPPDAGLAPEAAEKEVVTAVAKALNVTDIDWKTKMVLVGVGGPASSSTTGVKVQTQLVVHDGTLTILVTKVLPGVNKKLPPPPPGNAAPTWIMLVDRFDGPVMFKMNQVALY